MKKTSDEFACWDIDGHTGEAKASPDGMDEEELLVIRLGGARVRGTAGLICTSPSYHLFVDRRLP